jgi:hypothetical protein
MKPKVSQNAHRDSDSRELLAGESILPKVEVLVLKRVVSLELQQILEQEHVTKTELASRMKTSRGFAGPDTRSLKPLTHRGQPRKSRRRSWSEAETAICALVMAMTRTTELIPLMNFFTETLRETLDEWDVLQA